MEALDSGLGPRNKSNIVAKPGRSEPFNFLVERIMFSTALSSSVRIPDSMARASFSSSVSLGFGPRLGAGPVGTASDLTFKNASFKQTNISGTSMASPQVAGVSALVLQINPKMSPSELKEFLIGNSNGDIYATLNNNDWSNRRSLWGGVTRYLFNKFNKSQASKISGDITFKNGIQFKVV